MPARESGTLNGMARIPGPAIVGLGDLFVGATAAAGKPVVLVKPGPVARPAAAGPGAKPAAAAAAAKTGPGAKPGAFVVRARTEKGGTNKDGFGHAKAAAFNALKAGDKALAASKRAAASVKKTKAAVKLGWHDPIVPLYVAGVRDNGCVVLGAVSPAKKPLTPAQTQAVNKHTTAIAKTAAATRRLEGLAKKAQGAGQAAQAASKQTAGAIAQALKPKTKAPVMGAIGEEDLAYLAQYYDFVGAGPDEERPGYLTDGSLDPVVLLGDDLPPSPDPNLPPSPDPNLPPDPNNLPPDPYADMTSQDAGEGAVRAPDGTVLYDPATDPQVVPLPQRGGTLSQEEANVTWQNPTDDAIIYDGSHGWPEKSVGSYNLFYGPLTTEGSTEFDGYTLGQPLGVPGPNNQPVARIKGYNFGVGIKLPSEDSAARGWGPLIGRPGGELAGLQYAVVPKIWFWQGKNAPAWAAFETDAKIAAANKKIIEANRAAALVQAAQMAKDALEQQQAKAKQDAANALAQSAADTQSTISKQQVDAQTAQLDVQSQKAELEAQKSEAQIATLQAQIDAQAQQSQDKVDSAAQHALVTQADIWNKWAAANPEDAVVMMQQGMAPGGANFGDGGGDAFDSYEDGSFENDGPRMYGGEGGGGGEDEGGGGSLEDD